MRVFLFATLLVVFLGLASAQTFCQTYSNTTVNQNATLQAGLITAIVVRAVTGGNYTAPNGNNYTVNGLFSPTGPLYNIFTGRTQYRVGAPDYTTNTNALNSLAGKLVAYFGALFGCNATGYPAVNTYNMYVVHQNMSINSTQENYFNAALAQTLYSFGVSSSDVTTVAAPALGLFNRCGPPVLGNNASYLAQICGTSDCPLATGVTQATCTQYYSVNTTANTTYSSSSTGSSAPVTPTTYPSGSVAAGLNFNFASVPTAAVGAPLVQQDIAYNIANETGFAVSQAQVVPYVVITAFNGQTLAPSRRLLQTTSVPVSFIVLGNITNLGSALFSASAATTRLSAAAASGALIAPNSNASIPQQTVTPVVVYTYSSSSTGYNGASGKYAAGGVLAAVVATFVSLLL